MDGLVEDNRGSGSMNKEPLPLFNIIRIEEVALVGGFFGGTVRYFPE